MNTKIRPRIVTLVHPSSGEEELRSVRELLESGWLAQAPKETGNMPNDLLEHVARPTLAQFTRPHAVLRPDRLEKLANYFECDAVATLRGAAPTGARLV